MTIKGDQIDRESIPTPLSDVQLEEIKRIESFIVASPASSATKTIDTLDNRMRYSRA
jgi:hypothetical protein